ncbi:MAG: DUF58 domain-containing protein [Ruminococcaceae bacterium]|nr:DUF58 domain-containing protein [Oscillospiraceae bacterium]
MIVFFVVFLAALALYMQNRSITKGLDSVKEDHWMDAAIVEPDEEFHIVISLKNTGRGLIPFLRVSESIPYRMDLLMESGYIIKDSRGGKQVSYTTWLRPRQEVRKYLPVSAPQRGRYFLQELVLGGGDFLGLSERTRHYNGFREVVSVPKAAPEQAIGEVLGGFMGDVSVRRFILEDPVLTLGYREYTGREPMKMISWTQSARGMGLMVKKYDYTLEPAVSVLLNIESISDGCDEELERCFSLARTVCSTLEERGIQYDFATNAVIAGAMSDLSTMSEGLGQRHFEGILEALGRATYSVSRSADKLLSGAASAGYGSARGRILITPDRTALHPQILNRLREVSGGNLLVIAASEVEPW